MTSRNLKHQIFSLTILLLFFGLLMIYSSSINEALATFGDKYYFIKQQLKWSLLGLSLLVIFAKIKLQYLEKISPFLMAISLILLILVLIPGVGSKIHGARRWLSFAGFTFQPSEIVKLTEIIYLSSWLNKKNIHLSQFLVFLATIIGLVILQPDLGTALVLVGIALTLYFLTGYPLFHLFLFAIFGSIIGLLLIISSPYRAARLKTFLNPSADPLGSSYHIRQIILALGSGGLTGVGIGKSRQKYSYLPETTTDSIFAVIGEELGFLGALGVILSFIYFLYLGFSVAHQARQHFAKTLSAGITTWFALQIILNLSSMVALTPLTGIPLPLISYGGSSLVVMLASVGLLINVSQHNS